jgi:uncharacterized membrane protein YphA (DoxX/SURF4 family)
MTNTLISPAATMTEEREQDQAIPAPSTRKRKVTRSIAAMAASALFGLMLLCGAAGTAHAAAGVTVAVSSSSQTDIWVQNTAGTQFTAYRGYSYNYVTAIWTGPGYCTAIRYADGTVQYAYPSTWAGTSTLHGVPQLQSWATPYSRCWS